MKYVEYLIKLIVIILGIYIGRYIFKVYNIEYHGPNSNNVKKTIHKKNNKCYIFEPHVYLCGNIK